MTHESSPWVSQPTTVPPTSPAIAAVSTSIATGPTRPQHGVPLPDPADRLPIIDRSGQAELWWVGVHGGAGESSLASLVPEWQGGGHAWPRTAGDSLDRVVLVARTNYLGLKAAQAASMQWAAGLVPSAQILGLVLIADAPGRTPRPLRDLARLVGGGVPRTWNLPWNESWRLGEPPALTSAPRQVLRLVDELDAILRPGAAGTVT